MSPEVLAATAGALLSLLMNYVPGLSTAFDRLTPNWQRAAMAGLLLVTALLTAFWTCTSPEAGGLGICLGGTDWRAVVQSFIFALIANQGVDRISPKPREE